MKVLPAVDILNRKCVQLVGGNPENKVFEDADPLTIAKMWAEYADYLHLIDLDAAIYNTSINRDIIKKILSEVKLPAEVGGGIRSIEVFRELIEAGADKLIIGTSAIQNLELLKKIKEEFGKERVIIALDVKGEEISISGWTEGSGLSIYDAIRSLEEYASSYLITSIGVEGRMKGPDTKLYKKILSLTNVEIIASGGISSIDNLKELDKIGIKKAVVGTAIYTNKIDLKEVRQVFG
ncbi:MAG: Imidazole glycerol phosphate synthase subunit HisF [Candidatus Methanofastidiosum methylothiophilum]|jgi:phosphoribosylformimino-5-aminoimidazole carboxamide ribotide isomerase|uniref:1-(5-phosphoribosyl)-5-[(5-phosphoribosylamino)methylideneamino] imidazole-4-carboxamide isomerase n=1 Tax=Candidatus Methanofastidiosum methylothiophilum TaxID=1705564 RepID=A0A150JAH3_9EURY|nr:MAG: Imidazole glycerol phosphate synthase subunit HisF [Candidatus Methanofastidiosum methylthiophilus]NMC76074.1 1-(5-phosphoribosyl)-5-[(5-phosphoribosylamino)methylideneamino]imidazole-4-carboxamide isomerase [Candidatus Methanofastidiosa archaeon]